MPDTHTHMPAQSHIISTVHTHTHIHKHSRLHKHIPTLKHRHTRIVLSHLLMKTVSFLSTNTPTHTYSHTHTHTISFVSLFVSLSFAHTHTRTHTHTKRRQSNSHVFAMCRIPLKPHLQSLHGWETQQKMPRHDRLGRANVKLKWKETTAIHNRMNRAFGGSGAYS